MVAKLIELCDVDVLVSEGLVARDNLEGGRGWEECFSLRETRSRTQFQHAEIGEPSRRF